MSSIDSVFVKNFLQTNGCKRLDEAIAQNASVFCRPPLLGRVSTAVWPSL
jgi:hypothetical protein